MTIVTRVPRATTHGRYLVSGAASDRAALLVGLHGYAENAEIMLERLRSIPGGDPRVLVSIQGLHRFYRGRSSAVVVAGWMTKEDRDLAIADNLAYVRSVVDEVAREYRAAGPPIFAGFSQGVAMAFRAAAAAPASGGVVALGGDVPPELDARALAAIPAALVGRGARDDWYTAATFRNDVRRLSDAGVRVTALELDAAHEWTPAFGQGAADFLGR